jgi:branched-chain amino acid transport system permease protein
MQRIRTFLSEHRSLDIVARLALIGVVLPLLAATPVFGAFQPFNGWLTGFANAAIFVMLAIGLNIVVGKAGLLDLGFAAFFAIGAYT